MSLALFREGALILLSLAAVVAGSRALRIKRLPHWLPPASAEALGATRMWIALILLANVLWEDLPSSAYLPRAILDLEHQRLIGLLHRLPLGFDVLMASPGALQIFSLATTLLLALATVTSGSAFVR